MGIRAEIKEAILGGHLYDFVSNNEHRLDKHELIELVKNLDFTAYKEYPGAQSYSEFCKNTVENLNDINFFDED